LDLYEATTEAIHCSHSGRMAAQYWYF